MKSTKCKNCIYCQWLVGIGQGIRCKKEENQKYKKDDKYSGTVIISRIPEPCQYYTKRKNYE